MNKNRPNFVIIYGETQGANVVGAYGHEGVQTPNIDRLAQNGILFTRGYTTCPLCTPVRAGMFTGIYPHTNGAWMLPSSPRDSGCRSSWQIAGR